MRSVYLVVIGLGWSNYGVARAILWKLIVDCDIFGLPGCFSTQSGVVVSYSNSTLPGVVVSLREFLL